MMSKVAAGFVRRYLVYAPVAMLIATAAAESAFAQAIPAGKYECWHFSTPLPGMNFTLMAGGRYTDAAGQSGSYSVSGNSISFRGANLDGQRGMYRPGPPPTIGIMGTGGRETESCQLVG
jgi:hypothetical protein